MKYHVVYQYLHTGVKHQLLYKYIMRTRHDDSHTPGQLALLFHLYNLT